MLERHAALRLEHDYTRSNQVNETKSHGLLMFFEMELASDLHGWKLVNLESSIKLRANQIRHFAGKGQPVFSKLVSAYIAG